MAYIAFDLDETLGSFLGTDIYTKFLDPVHMNKATDPGLKARMDAAFDTFAYCVLSQTNQANVLRPNLLSIMNRLAQLKDAGTVKSMAIYSNNGNISSLRLAQRMIEIGIGRTDLFCDTIHWYHPIRKQPINANVLTNVGSMYPTLVNYLSQDPREVIQGKPGVAVKTMKTLRSIFEQNQCRSDIDPTPENIFFFDDAFHPNIKKYIGENYFSIQPFRQPQDKDRLRQCFLYALQSQGLDTDPTYVDFFSADWKTPGVTGLSAILDKINELEAIQTQTELQQGITHAPFQDDTAQIEHFIESKIAPIQSVQYDTQGNVGMKEGGKRKATRRGKTRRSQRKRKSY